LSQTGVGSTENDCVVKFSLLNPNLWRVWPFGGIFCLRFFREGCSPSRRAAPGGGYYVLQHGNRILSDSWNLGDLEKI